MAEADAEKVLLEWCGHLSVPRWVDEKAYNNCKSCSAKMDGFITKGNKHHCRLCGQMFCGSCTAKYHVPLIFRIKNKDGPARVCMSCVEGCMAEKARASAPAVNPLSVSKLTQSSLASTQVSASLQSMVKTVEIAPPGPWEEEAAFVACPKCAAKKCKTHNCRVCGILYCDKCTSKMDIPACFERKKGKTGPSRVCDACRYKIVGGAKLVEKLSPAAAAAAAAAAPPPPAAGSSSPKAGKQPPPPPPGALAGSSSSSAAAAGSPPRVSEAPVSTVIHATVKREGDGSLVCQLAIPSPQTSLATLDTLLKKMAPQGEAYSFVFRGAPIPEAFHSIFLAKHLGTTLLIRPKHRHDLVSLQEEEWDGYGGEGGGGGGGGDGSGESGGVSAANNPFKRDPGAERALAEKKRREKEKPKEEAAKAARQFKRPAKKQVVPVLVKPLSTAAAANGVTINPVTGKKVPPPPPGSAASSSSSSSASAAASDDVFKQRAKKLFGQI